MRVIKDMIRQLQYIIEVEDSDKTIGTLLKEKEYSRGTIIELKKTKTGIKKNGTWAGVNEKINEGDVIDISLEDKVTSDNIVPVKGEFEVLYEDEDLLIVSKPYDTPIHPSVNNYSNTLANAVAYYFKEQNKDYVFRCINRLDRDTTGVTIIAKNLLSASILSKRLKDREFSRIYIAMVEGETEKEGTINLPIGRAPNSIIERQVDIENGKPAITHYRTLEVFEYEGQKISMVELKLDTGRTHQIRVHMKAIGHPLLGDFLYNPNNRMLTRQALHAVECEFRHPVTGENMKVRAPLPKDMDNLLINTNN